ncbi:hypothetical protein RRSWK_02791 [Rhodopirellula sp. SWK7]|nr:hypothetical protein RRSWK_02791 [Rhodopirellula sp. SWK7]
MGLQKEDAGTRFLSACRYLLDDESGARPDTCSQRVAYFAEGLFDQTQYRHAGWVAAPLRVIDW